MRAYLLTLGAGLQFVTRRDHAQTTATEKGGCWEEVEIPTDKAGLIPFLNRFADRARNADDRLARFFREERRDLGWEGDAEGFDPVEAAITFLRREVPQAARNAPSRCPTCHRTPAGAERIAEGEAADVICERIQQADAPRLARFAEAVAFRFREVAAQLGAGGGK